MAVLATLALLDSQQHALGVDITGLERDYFRDAQSSAIGGGECRLVLRPRRRLEQQRDLFDAEHAGSRRGSRTTVSRRARSGRSSVTVKKKRKAATALLMLGGRIPVCA